MSAPDLMLLKSRLPLHLPTAEYLERCGWTVNETTETAMKGDVVLYFAQMVPEDLINFSLSRTGLHKNPCLLSDLIPMQPESQEATMGSHGFGPIPISLEDPAAQHAMLMEHTSSVGWECPVCYRVWAPSVLECPGPHPHKHEELCK